MMKFKSRRHWFVSITKHFFLTMCIKKFSANKYQLKVLQQNTYHSYNYEVGGSGYIKELLYFR